MRVDVLIRVKEIISVDIMSCYTYVCRESGYRKKALYENGQISKQTLVNRIESIFMSNVQRHTSEVLGEVKNTFPDKDKKTTQTQDDILENIIAEAKTLKHNITLAVTAYQNALDAHQPKLAINALYSQVTEEKQKYRLSYTLLRPTDKQLCCLRIPKFSVYGAHSERCMALL